MNVLRLGRSMRLLRFASFPPAMLWVKEYGVNTAKIFRIYSFYVIFQWNFCFDFIDQLISNRTSGDIMNNRRLRP
jgi:hypothetical protein